MIKIDPGFLGSGQFPFDDIIEKIVEELQKRNWPMNNQNIMFAESREELRWLKIKSLRIEFLGRYGTTLIIPGKELCVYPSEDGPTLKVGKAEYTGSLHPEAPPVTIDGKRSPYLVPREMFPSKANRGKYFETTKVFAEFTKACQKALDYVKKLPLPEK